MSPSDCEKEREILEAVRAGRWPDRVEDPLRAHAACCPVCADALLIAKFLQQEVGLAAAEARLPAPGLVWWKAQLLARRAAAERATQPIAIAEKVACVWGILSLLGMTIWQWPRIYGWMIRLAGSRQSTGNWVPPLWGELSNYIAIALVSVSILVAFLLYIAWADE